MSGRPARRLRDGRATAADEAFFARFLALHDELLAAVVERLHDLDAPNGTPLVPTSRLKTRETLLEKLRRERTRLSTVHDVAGARVVIEGSRQDQDAVADEVVHLLPATGKIVDRRANPSQGYRAVHVVAHVDGRWIEVQVRTRLQHLWAETFERLADQFGRRMRYEPVASDSVEYQFTSAMLGLSEEMDAAEREQDPAWANDVAIRLRAVYDTLGRT
ncbi:MAG: RelA/SpoT domain-containing protein [Dehalococcoidia bacterium]|nr:RelA/SpoT domain-containing protein [Dehalococcoidia bacterium]